MKSFTKLALMLCGSDYKNQKELTLGPKLYKSETIMMISIKRFTIKAYYLSGRLSKLQLLVGNMMNLKPPTLRSKKLAN